MLWLILLIFFLLLIIIGLAYYYFFIYKKEYTYESLITMKVEDIDKMNSEEFRKLMIDLRKDEKKQRSNEEIKVLLSKIKDILEVIQKREYKEAKKSAENRIEKEKIEKTNHGFCIPYITEANVMLPITFSHMRKQDNKIQCNGNSNAIDKCYGGSEPIQNCTMNAGQFDEKNLYTCTDEDFNKKYSPCYMAKKLLQ